MNRNVETVQELYASFARGDVPAILQQLHPEVEWEHDWGGTPLPWYQARHGRDGVKGFFQAIQELEFLRFEPTAYLSNDTMVAVPVRFEVIVKTSGRRVSDLEMQLWTFNSEGQVTRFRHFVDTLLLSKAMKF